MLRYDPVPWLMAQEGLPALRARRMLGLSREGDAAAVAALEGELATEQAGDGSFSASPMRTAGVLSLLADLRAGASGPLIAAGGAYLFAVLEAQPGYARAEEIQPGSLQAPCDLGGFFGPYVSRNRPETLLWGAQEMNWYRRYEPLLGPRTEVRVQRRSSLDRTGPPSCYSWGLLPLCAIIRALCRTGHARDERLQPALAALLGAQRESGGWCRNLGGHPQCTIHALWALGAHPELRQSTAAERVLGFMDNAPRGSWRRGTSLYAALRGLAAFDHPIARRLIGEALDLAAPRQRRNGTFGTPCAVERVAAVLLTARAVGLQVGATS